MFLIIFGLLLLPTLFCLPFKKEDNLLSWACNGVDLNYGNSTYCLYVNNTLGFNEAENFCNGNGTLVQTKGHLVAIHNSFVNAFFRGILQQYGLSNIWLGALANSDFGVIYDYEYWNDLTAFDYDNFATNPPTHAETYLTMNNTGKWDVVTNKNMLLPFICQSPQQKEL